MVFYLSDLYTLLLIFSLLIFSTLVFFERNRLFLLIEHAINRKYSLIYHRQDSTIYNVFTTLNNLIIISIIVSFYIFHIKEIVSFLIFIKIGLILFMFFIIRMAIIYAIGILFESIETIKRYYYIYCTNLHFISLFFFPIIFFISYFEQGVFINNISIYIYYFFILFYFILKIILFQRLNVLSIPFMLYNILYLCAVEVLPYLVLLKLLNNIN